MKKMKFKAEIFDWAFEREQARMLAVIEAVKERNPGLRSSEEPVRLLSLVIIALQPGVCKFTDLAFVNSRKFSMNKRGEQ